MVAEPLSAPFVFETLGPREVQASFRVGDSWCRLRSLELPSGLRLSITSGCYEAGFAIAVVQPPTELDVVTSRGAAVLARTAEGRELTLGGDSYHLSRAERALPLSVYATSERPFESVAVSCSRERLRELLGAARLPESVAALEEASNGFGLSRRTTTPALAQLLEEIAGAGVSGRARLLWHEAKALELLALVTDELEDADSGRASRLSRRDVERLERVRVTLLRRLEDPPRLAALARDAGFSETKLKVAFRERFGSPIFSWLRRARLNEARRLLVARAGNVTEVATRVGYQNPSKFAAAFRRQFGVSPSDV